MNQDIKNALGIWIAIILSCEKIFGKLPKVFSYKDIPRLEVIAALEDTKTCCPWSDLINIIRDNEKVEVFCEY